MSVRQSESRGGQDDAATAQPAEQNAAKHLANCLESISCQLPADGLATVGLRPPFARPSSPTPLAGAFRYARVRSAAPRINRNQPPQGGAVFGVSSGFRFCNGPWFVNPSFSFLASILSPGSCFCPGSARNRHLMGFEEDRSTNLDSVVNAMCDIAV